MKPYQFIYRLFVHLLAKNRRVINIAKSAKPFSRGWVWTFDMLAGVMVLWIMLYCTQPAQADKSPSTSALEDTLFTGHITLKPKYHVSYGGSEENILWIAEGNLFIDFDGKANGLNKARIDFNRIDISYDLVDSADEFCTTIHYFAVAIAEAEVTSYSLFDPKEPAFTIPFKIGNAKFLEYEMTGDCPGMVGEDDGTIIYPSIDGMSTLMNKIKLHIIAHPGNFLSGTCSLPGWDEATGGPYVYSEECLWSAYLENYTPDWEDLE
jgi:hypothetical protein